MVGVNLWVIWDIEGFRQVAGGMNIQSKVSNVRSTA